MKDFLTINLENTDLLHQDLILEIPSIDFVICADTYYYALDNSIENFVDLNKKKKVVLSILLNQWRLKVEQLGVQDICFLPFDFSDNYIGCFKFEILENNFINGVYGITQTILGMMISPSKIEQFTIGDVDFAKESPSFNIQKIDFLTSINNNLIRLNN